MSDTTFEQPRSDREQQVLDQLEDRIDTAVMKVVREHILRGSQEPDITSRVLQEIVREVEHHPIDVPGITVDVQTEVMKSIGSSAEKNSGADAYISVVRTDGDERVSKGMLVQAKRETSLSKRAERVRLGSQCRKMRRRTDEAYVLVFSETGAKSAPAPPYARAPQPRGSLNHWRTTPGKMISDAVACQKGDRNIGRDIDRPLHEAMREVTQRLGAPRWLSLTITD